MVKSEKIGTRTARRHDGEETDTDDIMQKPENRYETGKNCNACPYRAGRGADYRLLVVCHSVSRERHFVYASDQGAMKKLRCKRGDPYSGRLDG